MSTCSGTKTNASKEYYRPYTVKSAFAFISAAQDKLCVSVLEDPKVVFLDVQDGTKVQLFQENLHAFANYAGSNINNGGVVGEFILNLEETKMAKPKLC